MIMDDTFLASVDLDLNDMNSSKTMLALEENEDEVKG